MSRRFYRSTTGKIFGGVCAGLGNYFNLDPVIVRLIFLGMFLIYGMGPLIYIILWIITPTEPNGAQVIDVTPVEKEPTDAKPDHDTANDK